MTGEHLKDNDAEAEDIAPAIQRNATGLLRRHISGCTENHARRRRYSLESFGPAARDRISARLCQAKIHDLYAAVAAEHDVVRFEIAMDDPGLVRCTEGRRYLYRDLHAVSNREPSTSEAGPKRSAIDVFADDVLDSVGLA